MASSNDWICLAEEDLRAARSLHQAAILGPAIYHTQQCAEKALKGYLAFRESKIKKTHDLVLLVIDCSTFDKEFDQLKHQAIELNPYVSESRYPEDCLLIPDVTTVAIAIKLADEVLEFVKDKLTLPLR